MLSALAQLISNNGAATVTAAIVAFFGAVIGIAVSALVSRRATFINAVTTERSKWIEKLRSNLADFYSATSSLHIVVQSIPADVDRFEASADLVREIDKLAAVIRLQLNPRGVIDRNIIVLLEMMPAFARSREKYIETANELLILHSQWLLKEEWEKVKSESGSAFSGLLADRDRRARMKEYIEFCKSDAGRLTRIGVTKADQKAS